MTDYIVDYENYHSNANLIDEIKVYAINFTISTFKFLRPHPSAFIKSEFDKFSTDYYHDGVVTNPKTSDRYDYVYY